MEGLKVLGLPGGATKGSGIAGAAVTLMVEYGYEPDIITGVSFGSMAAVPLALGMYSHVLNESTKITLRRIFKKPPVTKKGKIHPNAICRAILGYESLGVQDIRAIMWEVIKPEDYFEYQTGPYADCYIMVTDYRSRRPILVNVRDRRMTYSQFISFVEASCFIPIATQGKRIETPLKVDQELANYYIGQSINNRLLFDGGLIDHNAGVRVCKLLETKGQKVSQLVSIYPRPEDFVVEELPEPKNIFDIALGTIDIQKVEISKNDQQNEKDFLQHKKQKGEPFKLNQIFLPWILESLYDVDQERLEKLQLESIRATREQLYLNPI